MDRDLPPQAQQVRLTCEPDRSSRLAAEAERRITNAGSQAVLLDFGVTSKRADGFILIEAARGIPALIYPWMDEHEDILSYTVNDVPSLIQEREAFPAEWYQSRLRAPRLPDGYVLLAEPVSIDSPSDERWFGLVRCAEEGDGMLFYEENNPLFFLTVEEALRSTLHLYCMTATLLDVCAPGYVEAHAKQFAALRREHSFGLNPGEETHDV